MWVGQLAVLKAVVTVELWAALVEKLVALLAACLVVMTAVMWAGLV